MFKIDWISIFLALALAGFGIVVIAGAKGGGSEANLWGQQLIWVVLGLIALLCLLFVDYRSLTRWSLLFYILGLIGLLLCFTPLAKGVKGAQSWIKIGGLPQVQPAEFAKLGTILFLAQYLGMRKENWNGLLDVICPLLIGAIPSILIIQQPDYGTALTFVPVTLIMMYIAGMPYTFLLFILSPLLCFIGIGQDLIFILLFVSLISTLILVAVYFRVPWSVVIPFLAVTIAGYVFIHNFGPTLWEHFPDHAKNRLVGYWNPEFDPKSTNYNINQSKIALGSGGFWGKGLGEGMQSRGGFLPELEHDFVFAVVGEQLGFIGGCTILGLFLLFIMRGLDTALATRSLQGCLVVTGVLALFFSHIIINIGMVTQLLPVTGLPLTFISYGGSFMLASMIGVGLIINVRMRSNTETTESPFMAGRSPMSIPTQMKEDVF